MSNPCFSFPCLAFTPFPTPPVLMEHSPQWLYNGQPLASVTRVRCVS